MDRLFVFSQALRIEELMDSSIIVSLGDMDPEGRRRLVRAGPLSGGVVSLIQVGL